LKHKFQSKYFYTGRSEIVLGKNRNIAEILNNLEIFTFLDVSCNDDIIFSWNIFICIYLAGYGCLIRSLSSIFQLYCGGYFYSWRRWKYPEKTTAASHQQTLSYKTRWTVSMLPTIWGTYIKLVTKYQISAINSGWEKCDEKWAYMFNVYKNLLSRQTGSRNLTGPKTLPTIWYTYITLVIKYQISAINSYWEKCDEIKNWTDGRTDRGKTVYPSPLRGAGV
jgi:hypothetical protein